MVAYSFRRRFVAPIRAGTKRQTIRGERRRHARTGEPVQLYCGMRTKGCFKIVDDPVCESVTPIRLVIDRHFGALECWIDGHALDRIAMEDLARADGFTGEDMGRGSATLDMALFWMRTHGAGREEIDFSGWLIRWRLR